MSETPVDDLLFRSCLTCGAIVGVRYDSSKTVIDNEDAHRKWHASIATLAATMERVTEIIRAAAR